MSAFHIALMIEGGAAIAGFAAAAYIRSKPGYVPLDWEGGQGGAAIVPTIIGSVGAAALVGTVFVRGML